MGGVVEMSLPLHTSDLGHVGHQQNLHPAATQKPMKRTTANVLWALEYCAVELRSRKHCNH